LYYPQKFNIKGIFWYVGADYILRLVLRNFFPKMSDVMVQIFQKILTWKFNCISNLSKQNLFETNICVQNRQVFSLYEINQQNLSTLGLYLKFSLYKILIFHCLVETDFTVSSKLLDMKMPYLRKSF